MKDVIAKELILDNFKSFGKRTVIPLLEGFTTISGPNGSGKSNLLDSILFCLGLSNSKSLRAERLPDLINNRSNRNEAKVTLRLDIMGTGPDGQPKVTGNLEVARSVKVGKNDYHSTYYLDGVATSLEVVHERLAALNISPKGYNVVMQGDVTRILTMGPVERRRIIDDLAGVGEFDDRIGAATKEMQEADRHVETTRILSAELGSRLEALCGERDQAMAFLGVRDEKDRLEKTLLCRRHAEFARQLAGLQTRISNLAKEFAATADAMGATETETAQARERFLSLDKEIRDISERERMGEFGELESIKEKLHRTRSMVEYHEKALVDLASRREAIEKKAHEADALRQTLITQIKEDTTERQGHESILSTRRQAMETLQTRMHSQSETQNRKLADLPSLRKQLDVARETITALQYEDQKLEGEIRIHQGTLAQNRPELESAESHLDANVALLKKKNEELKVLTKKKEQLNYDLLDAKSACREKKARFFDLQEQAKRAAQVVAKLEGARQAVSESGVGATNGILQAGIPGIHGRVIDLATIPEEYRTAIDAAAGRRMEFVVCTDEHVAVKAIELLKSRQMGRVTFLPMTKIRGVMQDAVPSKKGVIGLAIDLIRFDSAYREIFSFVLGNTLIIDDIKTGLPMMGQHRMVSLEGDLLEKTGAMTGGSTPQRRPRTDLDFATARRQLDAIESEARSLRDAIPKLEATEAELTEVMQKAHRDEMDLNATAGHLAREVERLKEQKARHLAKVEQATHGIARCTRDREAFANEVLKAQTNVVACETELGDAERHLATTVPKELAEEMRFVEGQLREADEKVRVVRDRLREREMSRDFHTKTIQDCKRDYDETDEKVFSLEDQLVGLRKELGVLSIREAELRSKLEDVSLRLGQKKEERDTLAAKAEELTKKRDDLRNDLTRREMELKELRLREESVGADAQRLGDQIKEKGLEPEAYTFKGTLKELEQSIAALEEKLVSFGAVNLLAIDQAKELEERLGQLQDKLDTLDREKRELLARIEAFAERKRQAFMKTFEGVAKHYESIYRDLSSGEGELVLEDPKDPFLGGLVIKACPLNKDMKRIEALSGGEKSLAALAFVFAFQSFRPAPFYIFDEVDMFLDNPNTERLAEMIRRQAQDTQFIVVSLKRCMIEKSQRSVGVYSREGVSYVAGLDLTTLEGSLVEDGSSAERSWN